MTDNLPVDPVAGLAHAWGGPVGSARLRVQPEDFRVNEIPVCLPDGDGEHLWLRVRKCGSNTEWVAKQLARWAEVKPRDVSYAGLKDRNAVTEQWFSIQLPGRPDPDPAATTSDEFSIVEMARHSRKLKRGALKGNRFELRLRDWDGDRDLLGKRLARITAGGVPNYFAEQRFGIDGSNLTNARRLFAGEINKLSRHKRGLYLSAARAYLFNLVTGARVGDATWNQALAGDYLQLDGRHAGFIAEADDTELVGRMAAMEIHATAPLWGRGREMSAGLVAEREGALLADYGEWRDGLECAGLQMDRRAMRVAVQDLQWEWDDESTFTLRFALTSGAYATAVLRECVTLT